MFLLVENFDFHVHAAGEFHTHQSVDGLGGGTVDVDESLVSGKLKLLSGFLVHKGGTVDGEDFLVGRKRNRANEDDLVILHGVHGLDDLFSGFVHQIVVKRFQFDSDSFAHFF